MGQALEDEEVARDAFYAGFDQIGFAPLGRRCFTTNWRGWGSSTEPHGAATASRWCRNGRRKPRTTHTALASTYTDLINGYGQQLDTLDPVEAALVRVELLRQGGVVDTAGIVPGGSAEQALSEQLADASRQLWSRQGGAGLTVVAQDVAGARFYLLAGSEPEKTQAQQ